MIQTVDDFDEATLFERLTLDRVCPVVGDESIDEIDLRSPDQKDNRGQTTVFLKTLSFSRGAGFFP